MPEPDAFRCVDRGASDSESEIDIVSRPWLRFKLDPGLIDPDRGLSSESSSLPLNQQQSMSYSDQNERIRAYIDFPNEFLDLVCT